MAIKVGGTTVIDDSRNVDNIGTIKGLTYPSSDGTAGQFLKTDGAGNLAFQTVQTDPTLGSLTKTFASGETATITLTSSVSPTAVVAATKEVSQIGVSSKGTWDVNATASNYDLHNTAYSTTLTPSTIGYGDISAATYTNTNVQTGLDAEDFYIREDGQKYYLLDNGAARMQEYNLTTANDLSTSTFVQNKDFNTIGGQSDPVGFTFKPDGTRVYVVSYGNDVVSEIHLSTAWDISTASYDANFSVLSQTTAPFAIAFKSDGTRMYVLASSGTLFQYDLSTAWDVSTASYNSVSLGSIPAASAYGLTFSSTGDRLYTVSDGADQDVSVWTLSTAWDISTATRQTGEDLNVLSQTGQYNYAVQFTNNGQNMYVYGNNSVRRVYKYSVPANNVVTLGTGSFASSDVGKNIQGNGGNVILTSTAGVYDATGGSAFTDNSTIASGSWSMSGVKSAGDADGLEVSYLFKGYASPNLWSYDNSSLETETVSGTTPSFGSSHNDFFMKPDGTRIYIVNSQQHEIYQYNLGTAWDLSTATFGANINFFPENEYNPFGIFFKPDGLVMFVNSYGSNIFKYDLSTAWDLSTATYTSNVDNYQNLSGHTASGGLFFKPDGTKFYVTSSSADNIREYELSTAWDINTLTNNGAFQPSAGTGVHGVTFTPDGTRGFCVMNDDLAREFTLSTAWDITTASNTGNTFSFASQDLDARGIFLKDDGSKIYMLDNGAGGFIYQYTSGEIYTASGAYHIAVTNSGGQIDSQYWTDLNTMTADEAANSGTVNYAVSTDGRTTWSVIENSYGVRPIVRNNSGTWQYNSTTGNPDAWDVSQATFVRDLNTTPNDNPQAVFFKPDGKKLYTLERDNRRVIQHSLSTAWDISTASSYEVLFSSSTQETDPTGMFFKPDGTRLWIVGVVNDTVFQYNLTTPWDLSTASYASVSKNTALASPFSLFFKSDGTKFYTINSNGYVYEFTMSTAWDVSSAGSSSANFNLTTGTSPTENDPRALFFKSDGTKMYMAGITNKRVYEYDLSTAWDITSASLNTNTLLVSGSPQQVTGLFFDEFGERLFAITDNNDRIVQYSIGSYTFTTSTTWVNGTINNEFYTLQEALGASIANRMNKTQLDAVTDANHYTLGNTLDLMIALRVDSQTNNVPTADGVTINYDAAALNQGAVLGTDYDYDFPANNKVRITSNAAQNLKIRIV